LLFWQLPSQDIVGIVTEKLRLRNFIFPGAVPTEPGYDVSSVPLLVGPSCRLRLHNFS